MSESHVKEVKSPKGLVDYEEVAFGHEGVNIFAPKSTRFGPRFQMAVCLLAGIFFAVSHHLFCSYLDGKAVDFQRFAFHGFSLNNQSISSIICNTIAYVAHTVLSAGIGIVFIQVFWLKLRREHLSVKQIDAVVASKGEPFSPSALPTWRYAFWLSAIASMATLMALISIVTPGSLHVGSSESSFSSSCTVRTVSLSTANLASSVTNSTNGDAQFAGTQAGLMGLTGRVLMSGASLQARNPCPGACEYEISFNAPLATCLPMEVIINGTNWLPPPDNATAPVVVWNSDSDLSSGLDFGAATRSLLSNTTSAVNCSVYNATYHAVVTHSNTSTSLIRVDRSEVQEKFDLANESWVEGLDYTGMQYLAIVNAWVDILSGVIFHDPAVQEFGYDVNATGNDMISILTYSPSFAGSVGQLWAFPPDLITGLPSFLQNITLSLLNDELSQGTHSTTASFASTCNYTSSAYHYDRIRLLPTYGAALIITAVCVAAGYRAIHLNGCEESVTFSRMLGAILNKPLFDDRYAISRSSRLTAGGSTDGQLRLVPTTEG